MGRLNWQIGEVVIIRSETARAKSITLDLPNWLGHQAGQHVDVRLTADGSGIVPLMAMLRHRAAVASIVPTRLLSSSRSIEDVIYRDELDHLMQSSTMLEVVHTLTRAQPPEWTGYTRRIDTQMLREVAWPVEQHPLAFICGPTPFVETAAASLVELGYEPARIKTERFGPTGET